MVNFIARMWYYFRMGYSTYLTFMLGYVSTLITVYYLAIRNLPDLLEMFPHFGPFAFAATIVGVPLSITIGWLHLKRSTAFSTETDISVEANPYYYKLPAGYNREVFAPLYLELLVQLRHLVTAQKLADSKDLARIEELERKLQVLINGGYVGTPRRKMWSIAKPRTQIGTRAG